MDKPIAWYDPSNGVVSTDQDCPLFTPLGQVWGLYPQREWAGLTDEEIEVIEVLRAPPVHPDFVDCDDWVEFARAIEAKLKEKNNA